MAQEAEDKTRRKTHKLGLLKTCVRARRPVGLSRPYS